MKNASRDFSISKIPDIDAAWTDGGRRRPIGHILRGVHELSDVQIEAILERQRLSSLRFGEAAVELKLVQPDDVKWALAQQFLYPYTLEGQQNNYPELVCATDPFNAQAEAMRDLRSQLLAAYAQEVRRPIAIVGAEEGSGKSFVAANLAVAFSQLGERTVLVDASLRTPRQQVIFRLEDSSNCTGLSAVLAGQRGSGLIREVQDMNNLWVVPVGNIPPNPLELLQLPVFKLLLQELMNNFDHVIVDTTASVRGADARVVAAACGAAIMVARKGKSSMKALQQLSQSMSRLNVRVAGVVNNDF